MRMKKTSATTSLPAQVVNTYNTSDSDTYSCEYINDLVKIQNESISVGSFTSLDEKYNQTYTITIPSGYTSFGILGYAMSGGGFTNLCVNELYIDGSTLHYSIKNTQTYATSSITLSIIVGLIKSASTTSQTRNLQESKKSVSEEENFEDIEPIEEPIENELEDEKK